MKELEKAIEVFAQLGFEQQREWLGKFQEAHAGAVESRRRELQAELRALEGIETPRSSKIKGQKLAPKYRSKKDTSLSWAGRGETPTWLREEMAATGKPLEWFRIKS